jgi:hypothetical protein
MGPDRTFDRMAAPAQTVAGLQQDAGKPAGGHLFGGGQSGGAGAHDRDVDFMHEVQP